MKEHLIAAVEPGSIAEELEIESGDVLVSVNGLPVEDVFDWRALEKDAFLTVLVRKPDGEEWELEIEKDEEEEIGLVFENDLMSDYRHCSNQCIFCFIDQMPPGLRPTLYFKDDDSRLSFLQGNYITLTNMKQKEIDRIIRHRLEPMNISVHTTNSELRCRMLNNRFAGRVLKYLDDFYDARLTMNAQIVLCKGYNDGAELERTLSDLYRYVPVLESLSVVPVGLTKYREKLTKLEPFTKEDARAVIETVEAWQKRSFAEKGLHYVHASDELYITAGLPFPEEARYDGYLQIENGVGMARSLTEDAKKALKRLKKDGDNKRYVFGTGVLSAPILREIQAMTEKKFPGHRHEIVPIRNDFFGESVTVAGLVTGQDIIKQLKGRDLGDGLILPNCMFRSGEEVFLDDVTRTDAENALGVPVYILRNRADALIHAFTGRLSKADLDSSHGPYELKAGVS